MGQPEYHYRDQKSRRRTVRFSTRTHKQILKTFQRMLLLTGKNMSHWTVYRDAIYLINILAI
jgi:hypothetical protein